MTKYSLFYALIFFHTTLTFASEISLLQAFHIAEIYTARVVDHYSIQPYNGEDHYVLEVPAEKSRKFVWVHKQNGRVAKIKSLAGGKTSLDYQWPGIKVVAHRGGVGLGVPENTLPAIQKAIAIGAQLIEIDIRETKDGHLILMHDETVDRTTNGSGRVDQMTLEQIRKLDAGSWHSEVFKGTKVPTLEEALELMKGKIDPDLDFKEGSVEKLVAVVNKIGIAGQCTHAGSFERNRQIQQLEPNIFIRPTISKTADIAETIRTLWPPLLNMNWQAVTEENIRRTHILGSTAFVNCLASADTLLYAEMAAKAGADYIQTDYPDKVIELLKDMGLMYDKNKDITGRIYPLANRELGYPLR